jgi:ribosome-binding protein aMBF1 (putative translation factor)
VENKMSEYIIIANLLKKDIDMYHRLLVEAIKNKDYRLQEELTAELTEMKDMLNHIEKAEFTRKLRLVQNENWREFNNGGRK